MEREPDRELWTYKQVSERVKLCVRTLRDKYVKKGHLKFVPCGRSVRFRPSDVEAFIQWLAGQPAGALA